MRIYYLLLLWFPEIVLLGSCKSDNVFTFFNTLNIFAFYSLLLFN